MLLFNPIVTVIIYLILSITAAPWFMHCLKQAVWKHQQYAFSLPVYTYYRFYDIYYEVCNRATVILYVSLKMRHYRSIKQRCN